MQKKSFISLERNDFVIKTPPFYLVLFYMTSSCTPFIIQREETPVDKTSVIRLICKEKQHRREKYLF